MKKFLKWGLLALILFISRTGMAQLEKSHLPPSPNASAAITPANVNMDYYAGVANISIPLHTLPGKDISIPISLDYRTTGIKVADVASSVGLGWSLNANAFAITRVVRGIPDGAMPNCNTDGTGKIARNQVWLTNFESCDAEHDIFYFSYPSRSGKMFLDNAGQPQTMPYQDILIAPGIGSASTPTGRWEIKDELGYTYYFGESPDSREETTYSVSNNNTFTEKFTFISTWYLTQIISPNGASVAQFNYTPGSDITYDNKGVRVRGCASFGTIDYKKIDTRIKINSPKYISTVSTGLSSCAFGYDNNRQDIAGALRLASVSFKDFTGVIKKQYHLVGGCFGIYSTSPNICTRLKLQAIKEGISDPITTHTFLYDSRLLPLESSYYTDHYGYFNVNSTDSNVTGGAPGYPENAVAIVPGVCGGRNKNPDVKGLAAILNEIQFVSGSRTVFAYDIQTGARVASISNYDGTQLVSQSVFTYSGETYRTPVYHYYDIESSNTLIRSSHAYNAIFDLNGVNKAYSTVVETFLDGSKVVRGFYNFSDFPDDPPIVGRYTGTTSVTFQGLTDVNSSPFTPYSSKAWMRGLPKSVEIRNANDQALQREEFVYQTGATLSTAWNMAVEAYRTVPGSYGFYVGDYMLRSQHVYLEMKHKYIYDQTDLSKFNKETMVYYYHNTHKTFPAYIDMNYLWHSKRIAFKYPIDLTGTGAEPSGTSELAGGVWALRDWHVITPIEKLEYRMDEATLTFKLIGGELSVFRKNAVNSRPLLKGLYTLNRASADAAYTHTALSGGGTVLVPGAAYQLMQSFSYDDDTAGDNVNVTGITDSKGVTRNFEYADNNILASDDYVTLGATEFRNAYEYNTLFGLTYRRDANHQSTSYEYDNFGRLKLERDNDGNIVTRYRYNTKNVNEFNVALTSSVNTAVVGQIITFTSTKAGESAGLTKYVWDFGDGQVVEETTGSVSHTYASSGNYTVKLAKINPEYGSVMATHQVIINPGMSVFISACGTRNLCDLGSDCPVSATVTGGCLGYTYKWYYREGNSDWVLFGSMASDYFTVDIEGLYQLKCVVEDSCQSVAESYTVEVNLTCN